MNEMAEPGARIGLTVLLPQRSSARCHQQYRPPNAGLPPLIAPRDVVSSPSRDRPRHLAQLAIACSPASAERPGAAGRDLRVQPAERFPAPSWLEPCVVVWSHGACSEPGMERRIFVLNLRDIFAKVVTDTPRQREVPGLYRPARWDGELPGRGLPGIQPPPVRR